MLFYRSFITLYILKQRRFKVLRSDTYFDKYKMDIFFFFFREYYIFAVYSVKIYAIPYCYMVDALLIIISAFRIRQIDNNVLRSPRKERKTRERYHVAYNGVTEKKLIQNKKLLLINSHST